MAVMTKTPGGEEIVILSRKEFDKLSAKNEDAADIRKANQIMARVVSGKEELLSSAEVKELLAAKTPLAFWRKKRGITQAALADRSGVAQGFISEIEAGKKAGDVRTLRKLAKALNISLNDVAR